MIRSTTRRSLLALALLWLLLLTACVSRVPAQTPGTSTPADASSPTSSTGSPTASSGCGQMAPTEAGTTAELTLTSGGLERQYRLHVPAGYTGSQRLPLVLNLHGHGETAQQQEKYTAYSGLADREHFLVVYPQGTVGPDGKLGWNAYGGNAATNVDDVAFFRDLLAALEARLCVDARRVYVTGISNGGGMANLLACRMADRITAVAPVAAAIYPISNGCQPARPVPYLEFHGTSDPLVPYNGSTRLGFRPIPRLMQDWATRDGCTSGPVVVFQQADITASRWSHCRAGALVEHYRVTNGGHTWPGATISTLLGTTTHTISATEISWEFMSQFQLG